MTYRIKVDMCHGDDPSLVDPLVAEYHGIVIAVCRSGPGGGNPELLLEFNSRDDAMAFARDHYDGESEDWIATQIIESPYEPFEV